MAVDMFIKIGDVKGESKDPEHTEEIDVLAWSWAISQAGNGVTETGGGADRVHMQDLSVTKHLDKSSPVLLEMCCKATRIPTATLVVRTAGAKRIEFLTITLVDALVSSVSTGGRGGDERLTENVTLGFRKVAFSYRSLQDGEASTGGVVRMGWDLERNDEFR